MLSAEDILENLSYVVDQGWVISPTLRLGFLVLVAFCVARRRILSGYVAIYVAITFVSVSVLSIGFQYHTSTVIFIFIFPLGVLWGREALILPKNAAISAARLVPAAFLAVGALFYPHFVKGVTGVVLHSPLGVVPCATLILALAVITATGRTYGPYTVIPTMVIGALFGVVGIFYLGIKADWILVAAALVSLIAYYLSKPPKESRRRRMKRRK
ncbi:MAG: hypothetical protein J7M19_03900 [Planctomycetes bacterium]|nr:hypothetical protein [Planctomycetota bacterium]